MKKIVLVLFCLSLTTVFTLAADYHLIQTQILDDKPLDGKPGNIFPDVWVMVKPDGQRPLVFEKLNSHTMETWLRNLPPGSVLHVRPDRHLRSPDSSEQWRAFQVFCTKHDIVFFDEGNKG